MLVKVSWDEGATFEDPCDLHECYPDDEVSYEEALGELTKSDLYWEGGGAAALCLIVRQRFADAIWKEFRSYETWPIQTKRTRSETETIPRKKARTCSEGAKHRHRTRQGTRKRKEQKSQTKGSLTRSSINEQARPLHARTRKHNVRVHTTLSK